MQIKTLVASLLVACGATNVAATIHGQEFEFKGVQYRYQQLAQDVFTSIPVDEWDESHEAPGTDVWTFPPLEVGNVHARDLALLDTLDAITKHEAYEAIVALESRNLRETCQMIIECVVEFPTNHPRLSAHMYGWLSAAKKAKKASETLMKFLDRPFIANAIAGVTAGHTLSASKCSTQDQEADVIASVMGSAIAAHPNAEKLHIEMHQKDGTWSMTLTAEEKDHHDPPNCKK